MMILPFAWAASKAQRVVPFHLPIEYEDALITRYATHCDDSRARNEFGLVPRPL